jgi:hypothetical protein
MAAPVGVELAKQPVLVDHLGDAAKARERARRRDRKGRIDRTRRIIERYHQVVSTNLAGQPGKARGVLMQHHPRQRSSGPLAAMRRALWRRPHQPRCLHAARRLDGLPIRRSINPDRPSSRRRSRQPRNVRSEIPSISPASSWVQLTPLTPIEQRFEPHLPYPCSTSARPIARPLFERF